MIRLTEKQSTMLWNVCGLHLMKNGGMPSAYWSRFRQQNQNGMWERAMNVYTNIVLIMNRRAKCVSESQAKEGTVIISARKAKSMTRTEAIERLMYLRDEIMPISSTMFGALTMAIKALEEQQWIPCSERLPETHKAGNSFSGLYMQSKPVLVYGVPEYESEYSFNVVTYCDDLDGTTYWSTEMDAVTVNKVTAWMPLPKPYREGDTE